MRSCTPAKNKNKEEKTKPAQNMSSSFLCFDRWRLLRNRRHLAAVVQKTVAAGWHANLLERSGFSQQLGFNFGRGESKSILGLRLDVVPQLARNQPMRQFCAVRKFKSGQNFAKTVLLAPK